MRASVGCRVASRLRAARSPDHVAWRLIARSRPRRKLAATVRWVIASSDYARRSDARHAHRSSASLSAVASRPAHPLSGPPRSTRGRVPARCACLLCNDRSAAIDMRRRLRVAANCAHRRRWATRSAGRRTTSSCAARRPRRRRAGGALPLLRRPARARASPPTHARGSRRRRRRGVARATRSPTPRARLRAIRCAGSRSAGVVGSLLERRSERTLK